MKSDRKIYQNAICAVLTALLVLTAVFPAFGAVPAAAADAKEGIRDVMPDTWVGTDALGREFPTQEEAGAPRENKYVGIFYFMFMDGGRSQLIDVTKAYLRGGVEGVWDIVPQNEFFVWAEPYFGYYQNTDEWVFRKHAQLLSEAGIDFIFLDVTNATGLFEHSWTKLLDTWEQMRAEGLDTPQVVFNNGIGSIAGHIETIWDRVYRDGNYQDLWFYWDGKPLIMGGTGNLAAEYMEFFTIRECWAYNGWTGDGINKWPWIAEYPQTPGRGPDGEIEQIAVSAGYHANASHGRSFANNEQPTTGRSDFGYGLETTGWGLAFAEQWSRVFEVDPEVVMITGWNEFTYHPSYTEGDGQVIASSYGVYISDPQFGQVFVDAFSAEYSRDIEPIRDLFGDNYYYQMVENIRRFKGVRDVEKGTNSKDVAMDGDFSEFYDIGPAFYDTMYDIPERNHAGVDSNTYINTTGRNDFAEAKVSKTGQYTYFYVQCVDDIVYGEGTNWMNLFLDTDQYYYSGWEGYDYVIGRFHTGDLQSGTASVERVVNNAWEFETVGEAAYAVRGNTMVVCLSSDLVGLEKRDNFDFKWADNSTEDGHVMEFMDLGDAAPNERFNYRYAKKGGRLSDEHLPTAMTPPDYPWLRPQKKGLPTAAWIAIAAGAALLVAGGVLLTVYTVRKRRKAKAGAAR